MLRTRLLCLALAVCISVSGCSSNTPPAPTPTPVAPTTPTVDAAVVAECGAVQRAYTAWSDAPDTPATAAEVRKLNEYTVGSAVEDGEVFYDAINGYSNDPVQELIVAVAEYNLATAILNASLTIGKPVPGQEVDDVAAGAKKIRDTYEEYQATRCSGR